MQNTLIPSSSLLSLPFFLLFISSSKLIFECAFLPCVPILPLVAHFYLLLQSFFFAFSEIVEDLSTALAVPNWQQRCWPSHYILPSNIVAPLYPSFKTKLFASLAQCDCLLQNKISERYFSGSTKFLTSACTVSMHIASTSLSLKQNRLITGPSLSLWKLGATDAVVKSRRPLSYPSLSRIELSVSREFHLLMASLGRR